jgi:hypothetical protein
VLAAVLLAAGSMAMLSLPEPAGECAMDNLPLASERTVLPDGVDSQLVSPE